MLRVSVESCDYSIAVEDGQPRRQISASGAIPEGIRVHDSSFFGPVCIVISDKPLDPPFQHGSIYWDVDVSGEAFSSLWLYAPAETIDRIADRASMLQQINVSAKGALVNGGHWDDPESPASVSRFSCCFGPLPAA
jgi:hypothetical protein